MYLSLLYSVALHILPLLVLLFTAGTPGEQSNRQSAGNGENEATEVEFVEKDSTAPHADAMCPNFYVGIGIQVNENRMIVKIADGYPASNSSLNIGDVVLTPRSELQAGEVGSKVQVIYENVLGVHTIVLVRDKICTTSDRKLK